MQFDAHLSIRPAQHNYVSGDTGLIKSINQHLFTALVDVTGHGRRAHSVALKALKVLEEAASPDVLNVLMKLDEALQGTAGAVAGIAFFDQSEVVYAGMGNITALLEGKTLVNKNGILGVRMRTPLVHTITLDKSTTFMMYSDGIHSGTVRTMSTEISSKGICESILNRTPSQFDDASILVVKCEYD